MNVLSILLAVVFQPLWPSIEKIPDFRPDQIAAPIDQVFSPGFDKAAHRMPYLEWEESPTNANGACVILISGGGYCNTCDQKAFLPFRDRLLKEGFNCVWLWYRTPRPTGLKIYQTAWQDGQRAVRLVRAAAKQRGFNPEKIAVMGCSAGSHLSLLLATSSQTPTYEAVDDADDFPCHINLALAHCPAYVLDDGLEGQNRNSGYGAKVDTCFKFDAKTCPICFFHGERDEYSALGSTMMYRQLRRMKIPAEVHLDAGRAHGVCKIERFERAIEFMRQIQFIGKLGNEEDLLRRYCDNVNRKSCEKQYVWPEGKIPNYQSNQHIPYIEWHIPEKLTTKAIHIVYSGGGYWYNTPGSFEVEPIRRYLNARGMTVVTMKYRTPRPQGLEKHVTAWQDLQRAIRIVRSQAEARGLDPNRIGIMGSSAGGHLTLMGAFSSQDRSYEPIDDLDKIDCRANLAVAIYPAYALTDGADGGNKKGGNEDDAVLVPEFKFDAGTCPTIFLHGDVDVYAAMNSVKCWEKLRKMRIPSDCHTLALRHHCFQLKASPGTGSYTWMDRIWDFMLSQKFCD